MLYVRFCGAGGAAGAARIVPTIGSSPRARGTAPWSHRDHHELQFQSTPGSEEPGDQDTLLARVEPAVSIHARLRGAGRHGHPR